MTAPPPTALVERRIAPGLAIRSRHLENDAHGFRLALSVVSDGRRVDLPPIPGAHLPAFLNAIAWAVGTAMERAGVDPITPSPIESRAAANPGPPPVATTGE